MGFVFVNHNPLVDDFTKRNILTEFGERRANIAVVIVLTSCIFYIIWNSDYIYQIIQSGMILRRRQ